MHTKGPAPEEHDGRGLRIGIVRARWNETIIEPLLAGTKAKLLACGVPEANIVVQSVPGSWELPIAVQRYVHPFLSQLIREGDRMLTGELRLFSASQIQASTASSSAAGDLLGASTSDLAAVSTTTSSAPFDAIVAIGVLIKGETMHFEYISDAVSQGLMRVSLDTGIPVIFGVLTVLNDDQARMRAGVGGLEKNEGHNHGEDWGLAAVEMGVKRKAWAAGSIE
jgi:6,7-dimethyl-8-ribityllumazine synthase